MLAIPRGDEVTGFLSVTAFGDTPVRTPETRLLELEKQFDRLAPLVAAAFDQVEEADTRFKAHPETDRLRNAIWRRSLTPAYPEFQRYAEIEKETGRDHAITAQRALESQLDKVALEITAAPSAITLAGIRVKAKALAHWLDLSPHLPSGSAIAAAIEAGEEVDDILKERAFKLLQELIGTDVA